MLPESEAPPLRNLDEFRVVAEEHGHKVRRDYFTGGEYTDEDGKVQYAESRWDTLLYIEEKHGEKLYVHALSVDDMAVERGWRQQWEVLIELNEAGLKRVLEEHGVRSEG